MNINSKVFSTVKYLALPLGFMSKWKGKITPPLHLQGFHSPIAKENYKANAI